MKKNEHYDNYSMINHVHFGQEQHRVCGQEQHRCCSLSWEVIGVSQLHQTRVNVNMYEQTMIANHVEFCSNQNMSKSCWFMLCRAFETEIEYSFSQILVTLQPWDPHNHCPAGQLVHCCSSCHSCDQQGPTHQITLRSSCCDGIMI